MTKIEGNGNANFLIGTDFADQMFGYGGDDHLHAGDDSDFLDGGYGADKLYGGAGLDTASYESALGVTVHLDGSEGVGNLAQGDKLYGIEKVLGSAFGDKFYGTDSYQLLYGKGGNDWLEGAGGKDQLYGGNHDDVLLGGTGSDYLEGGDGDDELSGDDWDSPAGTDRLKGGAGNDYLDGGVGRDELWGGTGADRFAITSSENTGVTPATRDVIWDFSQADGDILQYDVDGNITFLGQAPFGGPGVNQVRYYHEGGDTYVEIDGKDYPGQDLIGVKLDGIFYLTSSDFM